MRLIIYPIIALVFTHLIGCTGEQVRKGLYQGLYEGNRMQERREMSPQEQMNKPDLDYSQYSNALREHSGEKK